MTPGTCEPANRRLQRSLVDSQSDHVNQPSAAHSTSDQNLASGAGHVHRGEAVGVDGGHVVDIESGLSMGRRTRSQSRAVIVLALGERGRRRGQSGRDGQRSAGARRLEVGVATAQREAVVSRTTGATTISTPVSRSRARRRTTTHCWASFCPK